MSGNSEMLAAFDNLAKSVNQVQISNTISRAQGHIDAIRQDQTMNEFEKIRAQQALAQSISSEVLARGGDAAQSQQARLSLAPIIPDEAMRQMESTGEDTLPEAQKALHDRGIKELKDKLKLESDLKVQQMQAMFGNKQAVAQQKQIVEYGKALDPNGPRAGNFGLAGKVVMGAQKLNGLFQQFPDYNVPQTQTAELSMGLANLVSNGSTTSQAAIDHVTPQSLRGDWNKIASWVTNQPNGLEQQQFMRTLHDSVQREQAVANGQIRDIQDARDSEYGALLNSEHPYIAQQAQAVKAKFNAMYPRPGEHVAAPTSPASVSGTGAPGLNKYIQINP